MVTKGDFLPWQNAGDPRAVKKKKLLNIVQNELTPLQRTVVIECIINGRKQTEVAKELGVNKSTVNRTLKRAMQNIKKFARYV